MEVNKTVLLVLLVIVAIIAIISLIFASIAFATDRSPDITITTNQKDGVDSDGTSGGSGGPGGSSRGGMCCSSQYGPCGPGVLGSGIPVMMNPNGEIIPQKVYTIGVSHDYGAYEYVNPGGYLVGFNFDLISLVCNASKIDCRTMWDTPSNCWDTREDGHATGGKGLFEGYVDACMGYFPSIDRIHVFKFSESYTKAPNSYFYVKDGNSIDPNNLENKKIGFLNGWASDEKCIVRNNGDDKDSPFLKDSSKVVIVESPDKLIAKIISGEVDAGFTSEESMVGKDGITKVTSKSYSCVLGGDAVMTTMDSDFPKLWDEGFKIIQANGEYKKLCEEAMQAHGDPNCFGY